MKLIEFKQGQYPSQPDPFILRGENGKFYLYVTAGKGVQAYCSDTLTGEYRDIGIVFSVEGRKAYWAPSVLFTHGKYYIYVSCMPEDEEDAHLQAMYVGCSDAPEGPFVEPKKLIEPFSIDSHVVENKDGLFIFYSVNNYEAERAGTYIVVDRMKDPTTVCGDPVPAVVPTLDEEIFLRDRFRKGQHWHTLEGAIYFREGDWHYLIYSGNCYTNENYYLGYATAYDKGDDLTKIAFRKMPDEHTYAPLIAKNEYEEGTGHNSVIKVDGQWYCVYHARDRKDEGLWTGDKRTARICKLIVKDGTITAERHQDRL